MSEQSNITSSTEMTIETETVTMAMETTETATTSNKAPSLPRSKRKWGNVTNIKLEEKFKEKEEQAAQLKAEIQRRQRRQKTLKKKSEEKLRNRKLILLSLTLLQSINHFIEEKNTSNINATKNLLLIGLKIYKRSPIKTAKGKKPTEKQIQKRNDEIKIINDFIEEIYSE